MTLLLTSLSVLMLWVFLGLLVIGLLLILKTLESVRTSLEKIATGVRAIEQETLPLGNSAAQATASLTTATGDINGLSRQLDELAAELRREIGRLLPK